MSSFNYVHYAHGEYHQSKRLMTGAEDDEYAYEVCWSIWLKSEINIVSLQSIDLAKLCPYCFTFEEKMRLVSILKDKITTSKETEIN
jgi:hypothetical protein